MIIVVSNNVIFILHATSINGSVSRNVFTDVLDLKETEN